MAAVTCAPDESFVKPGKCCHRCDAGSYMKTECDKDKRTECAKCESGLFTATRNTLPSCHHCKLCSSINNHRYFKNCTAQENAVCECMPGFYCTTKDCDHCQPLSHCGRGEGVKDQANRTSDLTCAPCKDGTFSNVTDFHSPCQPHTRCEDLGRYLKTEGTNTKDAVCGDIKTGCHWMLPAGLWSGLVLTAFVLFLLICWREKRKSYRTASPIVPVTLNGIVPAAPIRPLCVPLPTTELKSYCQESCTVDGCDLPLYTPDDNAVSTQDSMDSCLPITPFKASVSFTETTHVNGNAEYHTGNFLRTYSEPQEDEWCGT